MKIERVVLEGNQVCLQPLSLDHHKALCEIGLEEELWRWTPYQIITSDQMQNYLSEALKEEAEGRALPFVTIEKKNGQIVGSTRFGNIDCTHRHVEIGWTWITPKWQRSFVNTEAKYLMLKYAFEELCCLRVEFKTDSLNERSRRALLRIGGKEEGTFRNHMVTWSGRIRHSVYYSITDAEWSTVKASLEEKLKNSNQYSIG